MRLEETEQLLYDLEYLQEVNRIQGNLSAMLVLKNAREKIEQLDTLLTELQEG